MTSSIDTLPASALGEARQASEIANNRDQVRQQVSSILGGRSTGLLVIVGPSEHGRGTAILRGENEELTAMGEKTGLVTLHALHPNFERKAETEDPHYSRVLHELAARGNIAMSLTPEHGAEYGPLASLALGSPNILSSLDQEPSLPVGVELTDLTDIQGIRRTRAAGAAPVVPIFKSDITDARNWTRAYKQALRKTDGMLLVDVTHNRDQHGALSQITRLDALAKSIRQGDAPLGVRLRATNAKPTTSSDASLRFDLVSRHIEQLSERS